MLKLACFVVFGFLSGAHAAAPYVFFAGPHEYPVGDYGVIDSSDVVVSTGNILSELSAFSAAHPNLYLPDSFGEIGDFLVDRAHDRILLFFGRPDEVYNGIIVLRLSDRTYLGYIPLTTTWGHKKVGVNSAGKIYFTEYKIENDVPATYIYDASTYRQLNEANPLALYFYGFYCFISKERLYLDEMIRDENIVKKNTLKIIKNNSSPTSWDIACAGDKLIRHTDKNKPYTLDVWDLNTSTVTQVIKPEIASGKYFYQWVLAPGGDYLVYGNGIKSMGYRAAALLKENLVRVFDTATGKETASADLAKVAGADAKAKFYFMDFSVDGKSIVFYSDLKLYVLDLKTLALQHKVSLPEAPEQVVW